MRMQKIDQVQMLKVTTRPHPHSPMLSDPKVQMPWMGFNIDFSPQCLAIPSLTPENRLLLHHMLLCKEIHTCRTLLLSQV